MVIRYSNKHLIADFTVGSLYLLAGILGIIFGSDIFKYLFTALGILYLGSSFYKLKFQCLRIENQVLTYFVPGRKKRIDLRQITRIKKITDEITFLTPHKELNISTKLINKEDFPAFKEFLASLDLEPEKNSFSETAEKSAI
ncbi:hypothetical protein [Salinimicrobium xinjiangense]|uniref:hypothetical protein n=1 Tax=Salinimicrobium xinjiangense TaxID=438596 RepID=UPI00048A8B5C|nr:hypothetical protein [Salinimicrobium xinjiangense]